ncbi:MAG TPA: TolC family protein [Acidobacteriaceae bacterium]|nr:TolC family protein [Acidobacteriaceae bacterium]
MRIRNFLAVAAILLVVTGIETKTVCAQAAPAADTTQPVASQAPAAPTPQTSAPLQIPAPIYTQPLFLRDTNKDYTHAHSPIPIPIAQYAPTNYDLPRLTNTPRLNDLLRDGTIYLSLADAVTLALENNFDIAIARVNLDIADTDLLRARAGSTLRGVNTGLVTGTLGGSSETVTGGGGPGGTSTASGGAGSGTSGLVESTNGGGPLPEAFDPYVTGNVQLERATFPGGFTTTGGGSNTFTNTNTDTYDMGYFEGFRTGTAFSLTYDNQRQTSSQFGTSYSPELTSTFNAQLTQHLLQGCCIWLNERFVVQAKNDRQITDSSFRQQVIYTITQVEDIYWGLVSAYEDDQAKERAIEQSQKLLSDDRKQLQIGTLAPLDVVNAESSVASDQQALISSQTNLEYQQLIMKQAIARDLDDATLTAAPIIPTDRVSTERLPEEDLTVDALVEQAYANNPQIEQAALDIKNDQITVRAFKNGLLPTVDAYAFYGASAVGGKQGATAQCTSGGVTATCAPGTLPTVGFGGVTDNLFNSSAPNKGVGINVTIPIRNRTAQADQARSQMEYRQAQMRLQQLYTQIRIEVINAQYALTNDRAQLEAAISARDYNAQSLDAEQKKYMLGASTTANVLLQSRNLSAAEDNLFSAEAAYGKDRANLRQLLADTLTAYNISIQDAATGTVTQQPAIPGIAPAKPPAPVQPISAAP